MDITERNKTEKALKESEEKFRNLAEQSPSMIFLNKAGRIVYANQKCEEIMGYKKEEFCSPDFNFFALIAPEYRDLMKSNFRKHMRGQDIPSCESVIVNRQGKRIDVIHTTKLIELEGERTILGILTDITERKKAEGALRESEEKFKSIFEHANDGVIYLDTSGNILDINEKAAQMFGGPKQQAVNKHFTEVGIFSADEIPTLMSNFEKIFAGEEVVLTVPIKNKKGQEMILECSASIAKTDDGAGKIMVIARDITERKKAEEQIAKLAKFPAENPNPVLRISGRGTVVYANKAGANLLKTWDCRVGKSVTDRWHELVMDVLSSGQSQQTEVKCDGRIFSLTFSPVVKANYVNVYGHDITERKKAEKTLITYQNDLRSLASKLTSTEEFQRRQIAAELHGNVSQTLALSVNQLRRLRKSAASGDAKILDEICQTIEKIMQNVQNLTFDLGSPTLYKIGLEAAISELLNEQLRDRHGIACKFSDDKKDKPLDDNIRVLLFQAVRELLVNVIKHAKAHKVEVAIQRVNDKIQISISDDGIGFDIQEAETSIERSGGFGLFNIRERIDYIDGSFEIHSQPGSGSRFILTAPIKTKTDLSPERYDGS